MYINVSDVGVSINLRPDRERASELKVRQYLACGKPVVASPSCNEFLVAEHLGSVVEPHDISTIARELDRWLSLSLDEKVEFSDLAFQYARDHLSVEIALARRFAAWEERLKSTQVSTLGNA
jgi:glycosyltransferase involved in cell wall biosynthesis